MDSRLDSIFRATFRPASETDTWQGIRREEQQQQNKRRDQDHKKDEAPATEDPTVLSVQALQGFLKNLLHETSGSTPSDPVAAPASSQMQHGSTARAAQAYRATANAGHTQAGIVTVEKSEPDLKLSTEEQRAIHQLLRDIDLLIRQNVAVITLKPAPTFLESLSSGVKDALKTDEIN